MLKNLLKKYLGDDEVKVNAFLKEMAENKVYTSKEENIDIRYNKLKTDFDALTSKDAQSQALIAELQKSNQGNEQLQSQVTEYQAKIAEMEKANTKLAIENEVKFGLLAKGAKANDIDYLLFKISQGDEELTLDKDGKVKGIDTLIDTISKAYPSNFEESKKKKVDVKPLEKEEADESNEPSISKDQFEKMSYKDRNKLYQENKELYETLKGE